MLPRSVAASGLLAVLCCVVILAESWSVPVPQVRLPVGEDIPGVHQWLADNPVEGARKLSHVGPYLPRNKKSDLLRQPHSFLFCLAV